jgi:hypothetical protein
VVRSGWASAAPPPGSREGDPVEDKELFWIEGSTRRLDGYNYFPNNPDQMIEWFDKHMK